MQTFRQYLEEAKRKIDDFAHWSTLYKSELEKRDDHQAGRICWDTAKHLYNQGETPTEAAKNTKEPYKHKGQR